MIPDFYYELHRYIQSLIVLGFSLLAGFILRFIFFKVLRFTAARSKGEFYQSAYDRLRGSWFLFIPLIIFLIFLPRESFDEGELNRIIKITQTFIIISIATIAIRAVNIFQDLVTKKFSIDKADNKRERRIRTQISFIKKILVVAVVTITVSMILLNIEGVRKYGTAIITSAGVAGIVLGFAAQKTLSNLLAGFQIAFTQPIKIEDAVVVEGEWGWIEEINLTYVVVKIWDWRRLIIPITYFVDKPFQNWTRNTADLLGSVYLYVDYSVPLEKLRQKFEEILEESALWDRKAKVLQVTESTEKTMQIRLLMSARNSPQAWDLRCEVREKMIGFIQKNYPESLPKLRAVLSGSESLNKLIDQKQP